MPPPKKLNGSGATRPLLMRWASELEGGPSERKSRPPPSTPSSSPTTPTTPTGEELLYKRRLEQRMATAREPALCRCTPLLSFRSLDTFLVLSLLVVQGSALNFYLIWHNHKNNTYFWFVADLAIVLVSMGAMITSYHHVRLKVRRRVQPINIGLQPVKPPPPPSKLGVLPFTYGAWFIYSIMLVARLAVILRSGLASSLSDDTYLTPQLLRVILSLSAAIFFFQVQSYHSAVWGSTRHLAMVGVSMMVVLEILDSIDLASLLIGQVLVAPASLEATILGFSSLNLVLPTFVLYRLCITDFGERSEPRILNLAHITVKTIGFDLPAFILRIFLWTQCSHVSVGAFLVKNGICLLIWCRYTLPDSVIYLRNLPKTAARTAPPPTITTIAATSGTSVPSSAGKASSSSMPRNNDNIELTIIPITNST